MEGGTEFTSPCHLCLMWTQFTIYLNSMNSPKPAAVWLASRLGPEYTKSSSDTAIVLPVAAEQGEDSSQQALAMVLVNNSLGLPPAGEHPSSTDYLLLSTHLSSLKTLFPLNNLSPIFPFKAVFPHPRLWGFIYTLFLPIPMLTTNSLCNESLNPKLSLFRLNQMSQCSVLTSLA